MSHLDIMRATLMRHAMNSRATRSVIEPKVATNTLVSICKHTTRSTYFASAASIALRSDEPELSDMPISIAAIVPSLPMMISVGMPRMPYFVARSSPLSRQP